MGKRHREERGRKLQLSCLEKKWLWGGFIAILRPVKGTPPRGRGSSPVVVRRGQEESVLAADRADPRLQDEGVRKRQGGLQFSTGWRSPGYFGPTDGNLVLGGKGSHKE